jgi:hypothetical protein
LDRHPSTVLDTCDRDGEAGIRRRDGRRYRLVPEAEPKRVIRALPDFAARRRRLFPRALTKEQTKLVDQALRGE